VQVINNLIKNNGLDAKPDDPEYWITDPHGFVLWTEESPKKIKELDFYRKNLRGNVSLSGLSALQFFLCYNKNLSELNITNCPQLQVLDCGSNNLTKLVLSFLPKLLDLACENNQLNELDVTKCTKLMWLTCSKNHLTELDLSNLEGIMALCEHGGQKVSLTLYQDESGTYSFPIKLNDPFFENTAIVYENGVLKSKDNLVTSTYFEVKTNYPYGTGGINLSGRMNFIYSDVGINSIDKELFTIYPNPSTGEFEITNYGLHITNIEIYDINGRKQKEERKIKKEDGIIVMDISDLPAGTYLVKIATKQGEIVKKVVKQQ
jgi:Leucine-rich repeat (LRR) protein